MGCAGDPVLSPTIERRTSMYPFNDIRSLSGRGLDPLSSTTMEPIPQYQSRPPSWVPQASRDGDLGYHGFHPPRPRQGEDILDATTMKSGYIETPFVTVTTHQQLVLAYFVLTLSRRARRGTVSTPGSALPTRTRKMAWKVSRTSWRRF